MSDKVKIFHGDTGVEHYITDLKDGIEARRVLNLLGPGYLKFSDDDVVVPGDRLAAGDYRFYRDSAGILERGWLAVAALAPAEQHDPSREIVSQLLQPPLVQLPGTDELEKLLFSPPSVKLPIHARVLCKIQDSTVAEHFQAAAPADLSSCISFAIDHPEMPAGPIQGVDKPWVAMSVHLNFLMTVLHLDALSGKTFLLAEHAPFGSREGSTRPDGMLYGTDGDREVSVWDEWDDSLGRDSIRGAIHFLAKKPVSCMYGDTKYMLCFAAAGNQFQFAAIIYSQPEPVPVPIGQVLNMGRPVDRAKLVVAAVNYYRFLVAFDRALPQ